MGPFNLTEPYYVCLIQHYNVVDFLMNGIATSLTVMLGLIGIGILFVGYIFHWKSKINRMRRLLLVLSLWDAGLLISSLLMYSGFTLAYGFKPVTGFCVYVYQILYPVASYMMTGSLWMILLISYERCHAVSHPFHRRGPIKWKCLGIVIGAAVVNAPTPFELRAYNCLDENGDWRKILGMSWIRGNTYYLTIYRIFVYFLVISPLPFVVVFYFSLKIMILSRSSRNWRIRSSPFVGHSNERRVSISSTSVAVAAITCKFLICYILPTTVNIIEIMAHIEPDKFIRIYSLLVDASNLLVNLHSASNCIFLSRWNRNMNPSRAGTIRKRLSFSTDQISELQVIWNHKRHKRSLSKTNSLPGPAAKKNLQLLWQLRNSSKDLNELTSILHHPAETTLEFCEGEECQINLFLDEVINGMNQGNSAEYIQNKIREVGRRHASKKIQNPDWMSAKNFLLKTILGDVDRANTVESVVANKFVSYLIRELKHGFKCRRVSIDKLRHRSYASTANSDFTEF